ncbi:DUF4004 family protein [Clostridium gasigenes]|uniref:DUF4004 domain-containing protein n=1 Tax=Clostridium gasigenes TaxID=94869 RepID=A0A1H0VJF4_9CLOT|nr:DUF4004 family protein [Clostridium gasigenes]MBB6625670.1 YhbD family protein [Clostridium gasigenes]MBU3090023.1 YhbD family protein [Clostridium gasigenes]SDP78196.1 Protein of unknown function [Clostridium gasigenes]
MHEELISKKELLSKTNISYGQLYRWKRKNIIPEEWFIKKSVSTGQETFFPRDKILERINIILELKDDASLDELANKFTNKTIVKNIKRSYLITREIVSELVLNRFEEFMGTSEEYDDNILFSLLIYNELIKSGLMSNEEIKNISMQASKDYSKIIKSDYNLIIKRKLGVCFHYVTKEKEELINDNEAKVIYIIELSKIMEVLE